MYLTATLTSCSLTQSLMNVLHVQEPGKMPAQQPFLSVLGPPYVYHVQHGDEEGFVNAVKEALANPIDR